MLEFSAMMKGIAAALAAFASAVAGVAVGIGAWLVLAWLIGVAVVAIGARERGRNPVGWALIAMVLTPPLAVLSLLVLPTHAAERERRLALAGRDGLAICPVCAEVIRVEALRCRHCASVLPGEGLPSHSGALQDAPVGKQLIREQRDEDQRAAG
ncbi:MAG: hypothetical protein AB7P21_13920 [Lautropia sp.]